MSAQWWYRMFRPSAAERRTEEVLSEVRNALRKLDSALSAVEHKRKQGPTDG